MKCNSCHGDIIAGQESVKCQVCESDIHKDCAINVGGTFCDTCYIAKTEEDNAVKLDFEIPEIIRRSYIATYEECPYKFYKQVIEGYEQPENIYAKVGIDLHELFNQSENDRTTTIKKTTEDFDILFNAYPDELYEDSGTNKEDMYKRAIDSIDTFYYLVRSMPKPFKTEETLVFSVGDDLPKVQATSDRINLVDGELEMIDWKTGNAMVGMKLSSDIQAPLYIYSVRDKYDIPIRKFTFYYLKDNKERVFERVDYDNYTCTVGKRKYNINISDTIRTVQSMFAQIKKGNFNIPIDTKKMYYTCKMCHIRKQGMCEGADIQVWRQYNTEG